ncbi:glycosyltransferase involved in cell wall biosynthesis [Paenibacillus sp. V4I3]|uniref:glycosyltransferase n=1 Tax=unclassified Paenibacillus TaxID=185978 RepID=UPI00278B04A8|nr:MULTISPECIES: glycosyltransferase [unclassified Paenibacillus]MDQ0874570.1 glycosyltransferase involved in cell wall biosynthesis [Paenibacillus sp. V4I3]MDQ0889678.1 glycosyltransferase involved in cell wall biosynthesis [Paenibacillus sp. V4I9]
MSLDFTPLLTTHLFVSRKISMDELKEFIMRLEESRITVNLHGPDDPLLDINPKKPRVYVSLGTGWEEFRTLNALPSHERKRWLHFNSPEEIQPFHLFYCWLSRTDPLPENRMIPATRFSSDTPLVSVFTASYKSKDKIQRPYRSLLNQTYPNWEWVIVDDSGDEDETYNQFLLPLDDPRVRRYRQDSRNGYIGATKRHAAGLCTGEILVEMDHDDELTPDCLKKIVHAFQQHPECGFVYGDCTEVHVGSHHAHWYGWDCGFGYSIHYRVWLHEMNRWQNVQKHTTINGNTLRHLVGLPNHPRAWTRDCYHLIGGHRAELLVADDYDMLIRTFLCTQYAAIPDLLYIQYRNENGDNSTFLRNKQIQILVKELKSYYHQRIYARVKELGLPDQVLPYSRVWETSTDDPARKSAHIIHEDLSRVSILFPISHSCPAKKHTQLFMTLQKGIETSFKEIEVVIVGRVPPEIETFASKAPTGAIRWWPMEPNDSLETCIQYAKFCASCKEKVIVLP